MKGKYGMKYGGAHPHQGKAHGGGGERAGGYKHVNSGKKGMKGKRHPKQ